MVLATISKHGLGNNRTNITPLQNLLGILLITLVVILSGCVSEEHKNAPQDTQLRLGIQTAPVIAMPMVAYKKGFFKEQGLDVTLQEFTAGKFALQALLSGSIDVATPAEVPPTLALLQGNTGKFVIVGQGVEKTRNEVRVVARRDGNLTTPEAYFKSKKRKLATSFGGGPEFFTYTFLKKYNLSNLSAPEIEIISQKPEDMPAALASGSVDAISIFEPFAYFGEQRTGDTITFKNDDLYSELYVFAMSTEFINQHSPETVESFLKALLKAETFIHEHPEEAKDIVVEFTHLERSVLDAIWDTFVFNVTLTPQLVAYMQAEEQWALETGKVPSSVHLPPFSDIIYSAPLRNIKPGAVKIAW